MRNTTEQNIEHYREMVNTLDAWIANLENDMIVDVEGLYTLDDQEEMKALQFVRSKTVGLIGFLERKES